MKKKKNRKNQRKNKMITKEKPVESRIKEIIAKRLDKNIVDITEEATFNSLGVDSLDAMDTIIEIEDEYSLEIDDDKAKNIGDLIKYVKDNYRG